MNPHVMFAGIRSRLSEYAFCESGKVRSQSALVAGAVLATSALATVIGANTAEAPPLPGWVRSL